MLETPDVLVKKKSRKKIGIPPLEQDLNSSLETEMNIWK